MAETFYPPQNCTKVDTFSIMPLLISHGSSSMIAGTDETELSGGQQKEKENLGLQRTSLPCPWSLASLICFKLSSTAAMSAVAFYSHSADTN